MKNPALSQESRYEPATVIPLKQDLSLLDWLEKHDRLLPREGEEKDDSEEEEELVELIEGEVSDYNDSSDDDNDDFDE